MDINVTGVWEHNITGSGVTVSVLDDGRYANLHCCTFIAQNYKNINQEQNEHMFD